MSIALIQKTIAINAAFRKYQCQNLGTLLRVSTYSDEHGQICAGSLISKRLVATAFHCAIVHLNQVIQRELFACHDIAA